MLEQIQSLSDQPLLLFLVMFGLAVANLYFPPIPLESGTLLAGYLAGAGHASLLVVIVATSTGMFCGSLILYLITRKYGQRVQNFNPLRKIFAKSSYHRAGGWFRQWGVWAIFIAKLVPGMSLYTILCSGLFGLEAKKAVPAMFVSNLLFFSILAMLGRTLGFHWHKVVQFLNHSNRLLLIIVTVGIIAALIWFRSKQKVK